MIVGVIPARYAATRLPGKPLIDLCGQTMIERVWRGAHACSALDRVIIATDDERIMREAERIGAEAMMTDPDLPSGTDRCYAVVRMLESAPDIVINIQGDEPLLQPQVLSDLAAVLQSGSADVATPVSRIDTSADLIDPNTVKVAVSPAMRAVYFSRSPIPHVRGASVDQWLERATFWKHIGIYAYRASALERHVMLAPTEIERLESLEQLRLLSDGARFDCVETTARFISVDAPQDADAVRRYLERG
ncbi:MAG: 3-deoxy-manno-octulosonate cytidylyltransferase [Candidatus Kapabacteria bacterium]|nr:3-deoxy-manno-octulosonate cytidylyltransferase [Candidatus Kapabacteria bacterium]